MNLIFKTHIFKILTCEHPDKCNILWLCTWRCRKLDQEKGRLWRERRMKRRVKKQRVRALVPLSCQISDCWVAVRGNKATAEDKRTN